MLSAKNLPVLAVIPLFGPPNSETSSQPSISIDDVLTQYLLSNLVDLNLPDVLTGWYFPDLTEFPLFGQLKSATLYPLRPLLDSETFYPPPAKASGETNTLKLLKKLETISSIAGISISWEICLLSGHFMATKSSYFTKSDSLRHIFAHRIWIYAIGATIESKDHLSPMTNIPLLSLTVRMVHFLIIISNWLNSTNHRSAIIVLSVPTKQRQRIVSSHAASFIAQYRLIANRHSLWFVVVLHYGKQIRLSASLIQSNDATALTMQLFIKISANYNMNCKPYTVVNINTHHHMNQNDHRVLQSLILTEKSKVILILHTDNIQFYFVSVVASLVQVYSTIIGSYFLLCFLFRLHCTSDRLMRAAIICAALFTRIIRIDTTGIMSGSRLYQHDVNRTVDVNFYSYCCRSLLNIACTSNKNIALDLLRSLWGDDSLRRYGGVFRKLIILYCFMMRFLFKFYACFGESYSKSFLKFQYFYFDLSDLNGE